MDIMKLGISLLTQKFAGSVSESQAGNALTALLGGSGGGLDIAGLVSQFANSGSLGGIVNSWLGDGSNQAINPSQLVEMFGSDKLAGFASGLGLDQDSANQGLSEILPDLIDQSGSGGSLLDSVGGLEGAMDFAKKLF